MACESREVTLETKSAAALTVQDSKGVHGIRDTSDQDELSAGSICSMMRIVQNPKRNCIAKSHNISRRHSPDRSHQNRRT